MKARTPPLTPAELEIMRVVWRRGEVTVRDVYEAFREQRQVAYTTVLTMMKVLEQKGHLRRRTRERAHVYRPARPETDVVRSMVREFVERVFGGSARPLLVHLLEDRKLTRRELDEVARTIAREEP
jgi:predicted transcriptional regulator